MNPHLCRVELRPRGVLEVFDLSWRLLAARGPSFVRLFMLVLFPVWLVALPIGWALDWHWGVGVGVAGVGIALRAPFTLLAGRLMFADDVAVVPLLWEMLTRPMDMFGLWGVHAVAWFLGAVSCGTTLLPVWGVLVWQTESLVLEQRAGSRRRGALWAGRRSWHLASQGGVAAVAAVASTLLLTAWFAAVGEACGTACTSFLLQFGTPFGSPLAWQATPWILFGVLAAQPIIAAYRLLLYVDTRTRTEGWDLQVSLRALGLS